MASLLKMMPSEMMSPTTAIPCLYHLGLNKLHLLLFSLYHKGIHSKLSLGPAHFGEKMQFQKPLSRKGFLFYNVTL